MNHKWIAFLLLATVAVGICLYSPAALALPPAPTLSPTPVSTDTLVSTSTLAPISLPASKPVVQDLYVVGERENAYRVRVESYKFEAIEDVETHMRLTVVLRYQNMLHRLCVPTDNINLMLVVENRYAYQFAFSNYREPYAEDVIYSDIVLDMLGEVDTVWVVDVPNVVANSMDNRMLRYQLFNDVYISPLRPPKTAELGTAEQLAPDLLSPSAPTLEPVITAMPIVSATLAPTVLPAPVQTIAPIVVKPQMTIPPATAPAAAPTSAWSDVTGTSPGNVHGTVTATVVPDDGVQATYKVVEPESTPIPPLTTPPPATQAPKPTFALAPRATANPAAATPLPTILPNLAF